MATQAQPYHFFDQLSTNNIENKEYNRGKNAELSSAEMWKKYKQENMNQGSDLAQKFIESTRGMAVEKRYNVGLLRTTGFTVKALEAFVLLHLDLNATAKVSQARNAVLFLPPSSLPRAQSLSFISRRARSCSKFSKKSRPVSALGKHTPWTHPPTTTTCLRGTRTPSSCLCQSSCGRFCAPFLQAN